MTTRDNNLRRQTRNIHQKGAYVYATVEDVILGLATVRMSTNGARLTNLPVVGGAVAVGQRVAIDYSAGVPPVVRPVVEPTEPTVGLGPPEGPESNIHRRRDKSCRLVLNSSVAINKGVITTISWDEALYQTDSFWTSGTNITLPFEGVYIFVIDLSWGPSHDHWDLIHSYGDGIDPVKAQAYYEPYRVELYSTTSGTFSYYEDFPIDSEPTAGKLMNSMATHYATSGEVIQMKVEQRTLTDPQYLVPVAEGGNVISPRLTIQWMGARESDTQ